MKLKKIPVKESKEMMDSVPHEMGMYPPSFYVGSKQIPEIKNWEVGETYQLVIEVVQKSKTENDMGVDSSFDIVAYKYLPKKKVEDMNDEEFGEYQGEVMSKS